MKQILADLSTGFTDLKVGDIADPTPQPNIDTYGVYSWDVENTNPAVTFFGDINEYINSIRMVGLNDNGTVNKVIATAADPQVDSADTDGSEGQVMVEFPKLWYKEYINTDGDLYEIALSGVAVDGFTLHPAFSWGDGRDEIYIGAYEAYRNTTPNPDVLCSISGETPTTSRTLAQFRAYAEARGDGWHVMGFWEQHLIDMLFYAYYGTRDSQDALPGYTEESGWNTAKMRECGRSNILTTMNGSVDAQLGVGDPDEALTNLSAGDKIANRFLFIENIFGHIWKFNDGCTYVPEFDFDPTAEVLPGHANYNEGWNADWGKDLQAVYAIADIRKFTSTPSEIAADYEKLDVVPVSVAATISIQKTGKGFVPSVGGGGDSQNFCARFYSYLSDTGRPYLRVVLAGGALSSGSIAGVACRPSSLRLSRSASHSGARLAFSKI